MIIISALLIITFLILNAVHAFYYLDKHDLENNGIVNEIEKNLNGKLIYSMVARNECKSDEEELILDKFEAIKESCNCYDQFFFESCLKIERYGCKKINPIPSKNYIKINSKYICIKKSHKSYLELLKFKDIIPKNEECPINYKNCGIIDTLERKLCVKNDEICPLKKVDIENAFLNLQSKSFSKGYNININNNNDFNINNNNNNETIFSIFRLDQVNPCINVSQRNWVYYGDLIPFTMKCTYQIKEELYDSKYEKISNFNISLYQLYKENFVLESLPNYYEYEYLLKKEIAYLYTKNFIGIDNQKAIDFSKEKLLYSQKLINNCGTAMKIVTYILGIPIVCGGGAGGVGASGGSNSGDFFICLLVIFLIYSVPASIIYFILDIIIFVNYNNIQTILNIGSDEYMNELIKKFIKESSTNYSLPLANIIIFPLTIIFGLITLYYLIIDKY